MEVRTLLRKKDPRVVTARSSETVSDLVQRLADERIGALPIVDEDGRVIGLVAERDILLSLAAHGEAGLSKRAEEVMERRLATCSPSDPVRQVMATMTNRRLRHVIVLEDKHLHGIISIGDVVKHRLEELETESGVLRDYIAVTRNIAPE
jgi:CBS domain-containing protein